MKRIFREIYPVMLTPFHSDGSVDFDGIQQLTDFYLETGATGLFANCLSSEMFLLTDEERIQITKTVVNQVKGRKPVVATGTFSLYQKKNVDFIKKIHETGVTAVIINSNQLAKENESDEVLKKNLEYILHKTGEIKLGIYECPEPYKRLITPDVLKWMAQTNRFGFLKETSCDIKTIREKTAAVKGTSLEIYNANIPTALDSVHAGCAGVATIASNFYPELVYYLLNNPDKNNEKVEHVNEMLTVLDPLIHQIYPMSSKYFLQLRGLKISTFTRKKLKFSSQDYIKFNKLLDFLNRLSKELKIEIKKK